MIENSPFITLVILFTLLLNVSIFANRQYIAIGGILIGFIWVILLGLLALATLKTKNMVLRLGTLALIGFCLAYPYLGGFGNKAKQLTWVSLLASLGLTLGFLFANEPENAKLLAPLDFWLLFVTIFFM
jgi:hypothetical protein